MPIDPRIPLGIAPPAYIDPQEIENKRLERQYRLSSLRGAEQQQQIQAMQMRQAEQELADDQAFRSALRGGAQGADLVKIAPKQGTAFLKTQNEMKAADLKRQMNELKLGHEKATQWGSIAGSVTDEPTFYRAVGDALRRNLINTDEATQALKAGWNEQTAQWLKQSGAQALDIKSQLEQKWKELEFGIKQKEEARAAEKFGIEKPGLQAESAAKQLGLAAQTVTPVANQQQYDEWRASLPPDVQRRTPAMFSPGAVAMIQRQGMTPSAAAQVDLTRSGQALTQRGQDMTDARGREQIAATLRGQNMTDARSRELVQYRKDNREATLPERKVYGYYTRMKDAEDVLSHFTDELAGKSTIGQWWMNNAPNAAQVGETGAKNQVITAAQRQFTEARLRKESGAAIPPHEFENDRKMYFPQAGDQKPVLEMKAKARQKLMQGFRRESGRAAAEAEGTPVVPKWLDNMLEEVK